MSGYDDDVRDAVAYEGLDPEQAAKAWARGLKAGGAKKVHAAYIAGVALPLVVEFTCPFWHEANVIGTVSKVRLLIQRDGWITFYTGVEGKEGSASCPSCSRRDYDTGVPPLSEWFLACRARSAGKEQCDVTHDSPIEHVLEAIYESSDAASGDEPKWTAETASAWLAELTEPSVPSQMGQQPTWAIAKEIKGHPPQSMVRAGQALRKARS